MRTLNNKLINSIIKTDFFLLENKTFKNSKKISLISNNNFNILDIVELHSNLKQFIRLLQFIKRKKISIHVFNSHKQNLKILKLFFFKNKKIIQNSIVFHENFLGNLQNLNDFELYILLNNKNFFKHNFFVFEVNSKVQTFNIGTYKIFNNLSCFKKLIFFIIILFDVLKNKN